MLGSVQEWCRDAYEEAYPGNRPTDPQGPEGLFRVLRGGSIDSPPESCRAAARTSANAKFSLPDVGFRVAMEETGPGFTTAPTTQR
jgi:formylglycine-generating enzyme required for sulfatase activity